MTMRRNGGVGVEDPWRLFGLKSISFQSTRRVLTIVPKHHCMRMSRNAGHDVADHD